MCPPLANDRAILKSANLRDDIDQPGCETFRGQRSAASATIFCRFAIYLQSAVDRRCWPGIIGVFIGRCLRS